MSEIRTSVANLRELARGTRRAVPRRMAPRPYQIPDGGATVLVERATRRGRALMADLDESLLAALGTALCLHPVALHAFSFRPARAMLLFSVVEREPLGRFTGRLFRRISELTLGAGTWVARSHVTVLDGLRVLGAVPWVHAERGVDSSAALRDPAAALELAGYGIELTPVPLAWTPLVDGQGLMTGPQ